MRAREFVAEITISGPDPRVKSYIDRVYAKFPGTWQNNHVMSWGKGDEQQLAMFELVPSLSRRGAAEIKWFQAHPLRSGVGSRAMQILQQMAQEDGIALTLYPWDRGQVSQAKLMKFYRQHGFRPAQKGSKNLVWEPRKGVAESDDDDSKKLKGFHQSLGNAVRGRVSQMQANMAILKAQNPDAWLWEPGDIVYSAETGRTYEIVGTWLDSRGTAKYLYRGNDEEQGTFVADRAHQTLIKISGKQGVVEGQL